MYISAGDWEMVLERARTGLVYDHWKERRSDVGGQNEGFFQETQP